MSGVSHHDSDLQGDSVLSFSQTYFWFVFVRKNKSYGKFWDLQVHAESLEGLE